MRAMPIFIIELVIELFFKRIECTVNAFLFASIFINRIELLNARIKDGNRYPSPKIPALCTA